MGRRGRGRRKARRLLERAPDTQPCAGQEHLWDAGLSLAALANLTEPVLAGGVRVLPGPLVRGDVSDPRTWGDGWVVHLFAGSWKGGAGRLAS